MTGMTGMTGASATSFTHMIPPSLNQGASFAWRNASDFLPLGFHLKLGAGLHRE